MFGTISTKNINVNSFLMSPWKHPNSVDTSNPRVWSVLKHVEKRTMRGILGVAGMCGGTLASPPERTREWFRFVHAGVEHSPRQHGSLFDQ
jgi:hypothetical protein